MSSSRPQMTPTINLILNFLTIFLQTILSLMISMRLNSRISKVNRSSHRELRDSTHHHRLVPIFSIFKRTTQETGANPKNKRGSLTNIKIHQGRYDLSLLKMKKSV